MKAFAFGLLLFIFSVGIGARASCDESSIDSVSSDGEIIELLDGSVWESQDPATSALWLDTEDVLICNDDVMINKDESGEKVDVTRLR